MTNQEEMDKKVRDSASLVDRLADCVTRIGEMCSDLHPPKMSIPVRWSDDDIFIITTLQDAIATQQPLLSDECDECGLPKFEVCINDACANQYK